MRSKTIKSKLIKLMALAVFLYIAYGAGKVAYQSWRFNKVVKELKEEVDLLEQENANLKNKILYYKTDGYKERVMREHLDQKKPGEEVLVIIPEKEPEVKKEETKVKLSNPQKWWLFFFGKKEDKNST